MTTAVYYLTPTEVALRLRVSSRAVQRRVERGLLPTLHIGRTLRIETWGVDPEAPRWTPTKSRWLLAELAAVWRVSTEALRHRALAGELRGRVEHVFSSDGWRDAHVVARRDVLRFIADHSTGPDDDGPVFAIAEEGGAFVMSSTTQGSIG